MAVKVTMKCDPVRAGKESGTVMVAPGTGESAIGGSVTFRTWVPEVIVSAVGTEWRPSAITWRLRCDSACDLVRSYVSDDPISAGVPSPGCQAVDEFPSTVADAVAFRSPGSRPDE